MTVITLTTVGYSEVHPLDAAGKLFTISLLALGVVALAAAIGAVTQLVAGGELGSWLRRRRMDTSLDRMSGHFIVCAYGRVGRAAVAQLRADRVPCLVIEPMPELAALLGEHGVPHLAADPAEEAMLRRAGVERAAGLLCAVDSDAVNVYITLTARPMNPKLTIVARASNPESVDKLHRAGADQVVSPYDLSGSRMAVLARHRGDRQLPGHGPRRPRMAAGRDRGPPRCPAGRQDDRADSRRPSRCQDPRGHPARRRLFRLPALGHDAWPPAISSCFSARPAPSRTRPAEPSGDDG
jgi:voltage-gated potassium channel Kch